MNASSNCSTSPTDSRAPHGLAPDLGEPDPGRRNFEIGEGGFGQVFLAPRPGRSAVVPEVVCIKVSTRIDGWLREAYFGQLLDGHPRAIRVFEQFPLVRDGQETQFWRLVSRR